ncbi:MAG: NfeD family protein [Opitutaceae bacterium]|nr:NfeD family protein [Opitutaceae bacterium]
MIAWWNALPLEEQLYLGSALLASGVLVVQLLMNLIGAGHIDDIPDIGDGMHGSGLGVFSVRSIAAFFAGFGWVGLIFRQNGASMPIAASIGALSGVLLMGGTIYLMRSMIGLQDSGTLNYANAVGSIGTVYVTIPPGRAAGGQVEVTLQGRVVFADARTNATTALKPGDKVRIVDRLGETTFVVEPA